ncbi:MAG: transketolase, partial [Acidimicrobiia bacterium]|nr:transketolase [Acidimicrobiia bacterium]
MTDADLEQLGINVIRGLAMDAPQRANSGHPGTAMALAPLAHVLWTRVMRYDPADPQWPGRDRFVLSAGHACILQYAMLYLTGYGVTLEDLKEFRQWESHTPGHPEVHHTPGIEITTGPLGQGFANAVGMGIAERWLRARFGPEINDHYTFVICSDGDLEEGISHEAASLAGHLGLGRLIYVYDDNHITIDGPTELAYSDNVPKRFQAYNWHVQDLGDAANDTDKLYRAIRRAMRVEDKPSMIVLRSHIGWPSPKYTDTAHAHGSPLGEDEVRETKEILGLPPDEPFWVPDEVLELYRQAVPRGQRLRRKWKKAFDAWQGDRSELEACLEGRGLDGWEAKLPTWQAGEVLATRRASNACINAVRDVVPGLIGGGADLTGNTGTDIEDSGVQTRDNPGGRLIYFGIREHAMAAVLNGIALHGGAIPFGGTFFNFSDYMRPAVRLAALSNAHVVLCWTHDSVGLGEDGPTHQPIEQLAEMRATPNLRVIRPADANEVAHAWRIAVDRGGPTGLVLTRQNIPVLEGTADDGLAQGAYVLVDPVARPALVLIGTGSEVVLCIEAARELEAGGIPTRVVSMP